MKTHCPLNSCSLPILAMLLIAGGCGGSKSEVVANINGQDITKDQYLKQLELLDVVTVVDNQGRRVQARVSDPLSSQAMNRIVETNITMQAARDEGVMPTKDEIEAEKRTQTQINPDFIDRLKALGYTMEDIDRQIQYDLAQYKLQIRGMPEKTLADVDAFVKENPEIATSPPQASFRIIVVSTLAERKAVDLSLASNLTFGAAAAKYSKLPSAKEDNGAYPSGRGPTPAPVPLTNALQPPELLKVLVETPQGKTSNWVRVGNNWAKVKVESKTPKSQKQLTSVEKNILRRRLTLQAATNNDIRTFLMKKVIDAKIKLYPPYLKKNWEMMVTTLKQRMNELDAGPPAGGTTAGPKPAAGNAGQ